MAMRSKILGRLFDQPNRYLDNPAGFFDPRYHLGLGGMGGFGGGGHSYGFGTFVPDASGLAQLSSIASSRAQQTGRPVVVQGPKQDTLGDNQEWKNYLGAQALLEKQNEAAQRAQQLQQHQQYLEAALQQHRDQANTEMKNAQWRFEHAGDLYHQGALLGFSHVGRMGSELGYDPDYMDAMANLASHDPNTGGLDEATARAYLGVHQGGYDLSAKYGDVVRSVGEHLQYDPDIYGERQDIEAEDKAWQAGESEAAKLPYQKQLEAYRQKGRLDFEKQRHKDQMELLAPKAQRPLQLTPTTMKLADQITQARWAQKDLSARMMGSLHVPGTETYQQFADRIRPEVLRDLGAQAQGYSQAGRAQRPGTQPAALPGGPAQLPEQNQGLTPEEIDAIKRFTGIIGSD